MKSGGHPRKLSGKWFGNRRKQSPKRYLGFEQFESRLPLATFTVTNFLDAGDGSLRDAILDANTSPNDVNGPDEIVFTKGGTIKLQTALPAITEDLEIVAEKKVTLNGLKKSSIFSVTGAGVDAVFEGLALTGGFSTTGGAAFLINAPGGEVKVLNCKIAKMLSTGEEVEGGAISIQSGNVTLESSTVATSVAESSTPGIVGSAEGGAIFNAGTLTIKHSTIQQSKALSDPGLASGGGIFNALAGTLNVIEGSKITKNTALGLAAQGGGINNEGSATITDSSLTANKAQSTGQGLDGADGADGVDGPDGTIPFEDGGDGTDGQNGFNGGGGTFAFGGAVFNSGVLTITNSFITGNSLKAGNGGDGGAGGNGGDGGKGFKGIQSTGGHIVAKGKDGFAGSGGNGGVGGIGGSALGAAIFTAQNATTTEANNTESGNKAIAGKGGKGGKGGKVGKGQRGAAVNGTNGAPGLPGFATI